MELLKMFPVGYRMQLNQREDQKKKICIPEQKKKVKKQQENPEKKVYIPKRERKLKNSSRGPPTYLEDLANETLYEIFEYLDFCQAYRAFLNLNSRFENLLLHPSDPIHINFSSTSKSSFERCYLKILPNQHRIKSLSLSNLLMTNRFFSEINLALIFTRLEKVRLPKLSTIVFRELLISFASLPSLRSLTISVIDDAQNRYNYYSDLLSLSKLTYCKVSCNGCLFNDRLPPSTTEFSSIEYLLIDHDLCFENINNLLSYFPQLRHLTLSCFNDGPMLYGISFDQLPNVSYNLRKVFLNLREVSFAALESMIRKFFSRVEVFFLSGEVGNDYVNANRWERVISSLMPNLRIFDMSIHFTVSTHFPIGPYRTEMKEFQSLFWQERQWFFDYQITGPRYDCSVFFYSINPDRFDEICLLKKSFQFSRRKSFSLSAKDFGEYRLESIHQVKILNKEALMTCSKSFPNATELIISNLLIYQDVYSYCIDLKRILPLEQLTRLKVENIYFDFWIILGLLSQTPNVHTLDINVQANEDNLERTQRALHYPEVSRRNRVRTLTIFGEHKLYMIKFYLRFFRRMENLQISGSIENLQLILTFLLLENTNTTLLSSLNVKVDENKLKTLLAFLQSVNLLDDDSLYVTHDLEEQNMHLWW